MAAGYCYSLGIKSNNFFLKDNKKAFILWLNVPKVTAYGFRTVWGGGVKIGDNVMLGAGSKILNGVTIGDNAKVGANCVVVQDIPADATCVLPKSRIIIKNEK